MHQMESASPISAKVTGQNSGGYGGRESVVESELTTISRDGSVVSTNAFRSAVLAVDIALSSDGTLGAIASAGDAFVGSTALPGVQLFSVSGSVPMNRILPLASALGSTAQAVAVAFDGANDLIVQVREPATLWVGSWEGDGVPKRIALSTISVSDTGHAIFHTQAGGLIACASCHPEGGDDGHVWMLDGVPRRTPSLRGTFAGTAPYHWSGEKADIIALTSDVYTGRMSGAQLDASQISVLATWLGAIPSPPAPSWVNPLAASRGKLLFQGSAGCASCHSGGKFTNNATTNVGTGGAPVALPDGGIGADTTNFQVPPLVGVGWRTPLMHDGCAATIADRFGKCATAAHGPTDQLSAQDISDLTAYLETL
jgi:cytochrome c553/mono/diheme cytochrome c family protein